jgi:PKD repeat protein
VQQNQCGSDTAFVTLSIVPSPIASFTASPTSGIVPLTVSTQNNSVGANQYFWNFGNGSNSNDFEPQFTFNVPGEYIVSLIAENNIGCTDQDTVMIIVNPCPYGITLPNTMSDNNDGLNDNINWSGNCIANITTTIYNRWGICVFTSHSLSDNFTGDGLAEGVYMYIISTTDLNGTPHQHKGFIHLFK